MRDGLADERILFRSPWRTENEELITLVAAPTRSSETRTLEAIAKALTGMHVPTPRGRLKWHFSSVKHLLDQAREKGLTGAGLVDGSKGSARADDPREATSGHAAKARSD